jgi:hypothetical protein
VDAFVAATAISSGYSLVLTGAPDDLQRLTAGTQGYVKITLCVSSVTSRMGGWAGGEAEPPGAAVAARLSGSWGGRCAGFFKITEIDTPGLTSGWKVSPGVSILVIMAVTATGRRAWAVRSRLRDASTRRLRSEPPADRHPGSPMITRGELDAAVVRHRTRPRHA